MQRFFFPSSLPFLPLLLFLFFSRSFLSFLFFFFWFIFNKFEFFWKKLKCVFHFVVVVYTQVLAVYRLFQSLRTFFTKGFHNSCPVIVKPLSMLRTKIPSGGYSDAFRNDTPFDRFFTNSFSASLPVFTLVVHVANTSLCCHIFAAFVFAF